MRVITDHGHAFDDVDWPQHEVHILHAIPLWDCPLSLRECNVVRAVEEVAAAGLIEEWTPPADADPVKPHPQMCLRRYWPPGRVWVRKGAEARP